MDKILVVAFDSESKAHEGSRALQALQDEGAISLYSKAVIARNAGGLVEVKEAGDEGPVGTAVGLLTGSLIGLLGGPAGIVIGAGTGMFTGLAYDLANAGVGEDFLDEVGRFLQPGKAAVVAEVWEDSVLPVDSRMQGLGGVVFRRMRGDILDAWIERDVAALDAELAELEAESEKASGEAKAKLKAKIDSARAKLQAMQEGVKARHKASREEAEAKLNSLREQAARAHGERKAKLEKRMAELQAEDERRSKLLDQAGVLIDQALAP
jgi:uncharacterized membrane protein